MGAAFGNYQKPAEPVKPNYHYQQKEAQKVDQEKLQK